MDGQLTKTRAALLPDRQASIGDLERSSDTPQNVRG
jgi:hypothetical protein